MSVLEPARLNIIGNVNGRRAIQDARRELAKSHGIEIESVGHCIDGVPHKELGESSSFIAMRERKKPDQKLLVLVRKDSGQEVVPHRYIGSVIHTGLSTENAKRMVHFYIIRRQHTPAP